MTKLVEAHIIWDRDHGTDNQGWYARLYTDDGQSLDCPFDADIEAGDSALKEHALAEARSWGLALPEAAELIYSIRR